VSNEGSAVFEQANKGRNILDAWVSKDEGFVDNQDHYSISREKPKIFTVGRLFLNEDNELNKEKNTYYLFKVAVGKAMSCPFKRKEDY